MEGGGGKSQAALDAKSSRLASALKPIKDMRASSVQAVERFYWERVANRVVVPQWIRRHLSYFRLHMLYYILLIVNGSWLLYLNPGKSRMAYMDALYLSASATTCTGLATVDMATLGVFSQVVLLFLIALGSSVFTSLGPVLVRRYYYKAYVVKLALRNGLKLDPDGTLRSEALLYDSAWGGTLRDLMRPDVRDIVFPPNAAAPPDDAAATSDRYWVPPESLSRRDSEQLPATEPGAAGAVEDRDPSSESPRAAPVEGASPAAAPGVDGGDGGAEGQAAKDGPPARAGVRDELRVSFSSDGTPATGTTDSVVPLPSRTATLRQRRTFAYDLGGTLRGEPLDELRGVTLLENLEQLQRERIRVARHRALALHLAQTGPDAAAAAAAAEPDADAAPPSAPTQRQPQDVEAGGQGASEPGASLSAWAPPEDALADGGSGDYLEDAAQLLRSNIEYRALCWLTWLVPCYFIGWQLLGFFIMMLNYTYNTFTKDYLAQYSVNPWWLSFFLSISSFNNAGLSLLAANMMPFYKSPLVLLPSAALILLGNTMYPLALRWIIQTLRWLARNNPHKREVLDYLLKYPRRCFTHLFPAFETRLLLYVLIIFNAIEFIAFLALDWNNLDGASLGPTSAGVRVLESVYQSISTRTAGLNVVNLAMLNSAMNFLYLGLMYVAVYPLYLTRQRSQVREVAYVDRELGVERAIPDEQGQNVWTASRNLVARDSVFIFVCCFVVMVIQRNDLPPSAENTSWSVFAVVFEVISAYGSVGLSLGYPTVAYSFSGVWAVTAKLVLCLVMLMGRHRGLAENIDSALRLPGFTRVQPLHSMATGVVASDPGPASSTRSDGAPGSTQRSVPEAVRSFKRNITRKLVGDNPNALRSPPPPPSPRELLGYGATLPTMPSSSMRDPAASGRALFADDGNQRTLP